MKTLIEFLMMLSAAAFAGGAVYWAIQGFALEAALLAGMAVLNTLQVLTLDSR